MPRIDKTQLWISRTVESAFNTLESVGSSYSWIPTVNPFFLLPKSQKVSDANRVGRNAPSHLCNTYWSHPEIGLADDAETDVPGRLFRRALGGAVTSTVVAAGVHDHTFAILDPAISDDLPSFSIAQLLDDASYLFAGCRVDRFRVSQQGADRAQYEADILGSGKHANPHGLTSLPALAETACMDGFRTEVSYVNELAATVNLHTLGRLVEWFVEHNNNHRRDKRRVGDPVLTSGTGTAAHVRSMPRGRYETTAGITLDMQDIEDWKATVANKVYTDLKFKIVGPIINTTYRHEFEIVVPRFGFESIDPGDDEGDATNAIAIVPFEDPVTKGTITGRVRNASATLA